MAVTSIWSVKGWLGKLVIYVENPEKTKNPAYFEKQGMTMQETQGLFDVIEYATQGRKTQMTNESTNHLHHYVSGVNCRPNTAREVMLATKRKFGKNEGIVAFHGIQSFKPGETTPEVAHEIGVNLAKRLWGDRYEVLVTTHLDTDSLHNHFVLNPVSFVDGIRFHRDDDEYQAMRDESDKLCREYGLSVIEEQEHKKAKHYAEWKAEKEGQPTYRSAVRADVEEAIAGAISERQFWDALRKKGYHIKFGKDITICPDGRDRGLKLHRNFGVDYTIERIRERILENIRPKRHIIPATKPPRQIRVAGNLKRTKKYTGLMALYFYYLYKMGVLPKKKSETPRQVNFRYREDLRFIRKISQGAQLLAKHKIETAEQLTAHKDGLTAELVTLSDQRNQLRKQARRLRDRPEQATAIKTEITVLSEQMKPLRWKVSLCEDIETRSGIMTEKIRKEVKEKLKAKEGVTRDEPFRGRRRTNRANEPARD